MAGFGIQQAAALGCVDHGSGNRYREPRALAAGAARAATPAGIDQVDLAAKVLHPLHQQLGVVTRRPWHEWRAKAG